MTHLLPPLNALRAFEAAARHLSFKLAAHELHVTPGAVGQQVKALEERLGVKLFQRIHRQLILTEAGQTYLPPIRDAFGRIASATAALVPQTTMVVVNLGLHAGFNWAELRAELNRFRETHPAIGVRVNHPAGLHELLDGKIDLLVDRSLGHHPGYRCDQLISGHPGEFLICPEGTSDCPEIETVRSWLLVESASCLVSRRHELAAGPMSQA
ncbi:LysR family transcriptional regulator [Pseudochelatococcus sp. B33]